MGNKHLGQGGEKEGGKRKKLTNFGPERRRYMAVAPVKEQKKEETRF